MFKVQNLMLVAFCVVLSGCVTLSNVQNTPNARVLFKKQNSMVFGRLISQGYEVRLIAKNIQTNRTYEITPPARRALFSKHKQDNLDQYYFSFMAPGDYKIFRIVFGNGIVTGAVDVDMEFNVAENSAVYLGSFAFSWNVTNNYLIFEKGNAQFSVMDDSEVATKRLWNRFPEFEAEKLNVVKNIIKMKNMPPEEL